MKRDKCRLLIVSVFLMLWLSVNLSAQQVSSFEQLQVLVKPGDKIYVTDSAGKTTEGRIRDLSSSSLVLDVKGSRHDWLQADVREIAQWRGDSLKNGALIGLATGAILTGILAGVTCSYEEGCDPAGITAGIAFSAGIGAAIGVGFDAMISTKQIIFRGRNQTTARFQIRPIINRSDKGVGVAFSF